MKAFLFDNPLQILKILWNHRSLLWELTKRNLKDKYHGQIFGFFWFFFQPIVFLSIYTFIFGFVFSTRQTQGFTLGGSFVQILSGLIPWLTFIDVMGKSSNALRSNAPLIKQVIFPIEILPFVFLTVSLLQQLVLYVLFFAILLISRHEFHLNIMLFPFFVIVQIFALSGIAMIFSVLSIFVRDLTEIIQVFSSIMIYATPIFYNPDLLPRIFKEIVVLNPFSQPVFCFQQAFASSYQLHPLSLLIFLGGAFILFVLGVNFFKKIKPILGNFL